MELVQVRDCDGVCCKESPRFPNADHSDCIYHTPPNKGSEMVEGYCGCELMRDRSKIPAIPCPVLPDRSAKQAFEETCLPWPQNSTPRLGETVNCCWQWVEDGD